MPEQPANTGQLPALNIIDRSAFRESIMLEVDRHFTIPLHATVIVIGGKLLEIRCESVRRDD